MRRIGAILASLTIVLAGFGCGDKQSVQDVPNRPVEITPEPSPSARPPHDPNETGFALVEPKPSEPQAGASQAPGAASPAADVKTPSNDPAVAVAADPVKFLRESLTRAKNLQSYTCTFIRQERLGLLKKLMPVEVMTANYRAEPLSVRLTWQDPESEFLQCAYVAGRDDGKVQTLPRKGLLGADPNVEKYDPQLGVTFGKTRNLITDFGSKRMAERLIERIDKAEKLGGVKVAYKGEAAVGPHSEQCFVVEMRFPEKDEFPNKLLDLYFCKKKLVPIATFMYLPGMPERCEKTLDASYVYAGIEPDAPVSDAKFEIDALPKDKSTKSKSAEADAGNDKAVRAGDRSDG